MVTTLAQLLVHSVTSYPKPDFMLVKRDGAYAPISAADFGEGVKHLALGLRALGFAPGQKLCLLSENRPEWTMTDFAALSAGGLTVPIYTTLAPATIGYIITDARLKIIVVENPILQRTILEIRAKLQGDWRCIVIDQGESVSDAETVAFAALLAPGGAASPIEEVGGNDIASIVYTSGTTGEPKGVLLSQSNIVANAQAVADR